MLFDYVAPGQRSALESRSFVQHVFPCKFSFLSPSILFTLGLKNRPVDGGNDENIENRILVCFSAAINNDDVFCGVNVDKSFSLSFSFSLPTLFSAEINQAVFADSAAHTLCFITSLLLILKL